MDTYLAVTCHFVDSKNQLASILLTVGRFPESHTAVNIVAVKNVLMEEWGIRSKVACMVADGAANMVACVNSLQIRNANNLVVKKSPGSNQRIG